MNSAMIRFGEGIPREEQLGVMQKAVARCLKNFDPSRNQQFSTSLFRFVEWDCRNFLRGERRAERRMTRQFACHHLSLSDIPEPAVPVHPRREDIEHVRECMTRMGREDREIISLHFEGCLSLRDIGDLLGCSHESARTRLGNALANLKCLCGNGGGD